MCVVPGRLVVVMSEAGGRTCSQIRLVSTTQGRLVGKKKKGRKDTGCGSLQGQRRVRVFCVAARLCRGAAATRRDSMGMCNDTQNQHRDVRHGPGFLERWSIPVLWGPRKKKQVH